MFRDSLIIWADTKVIKCSVSLFFFVLVSEVISLMVYLLPSVVDPDPYSYNDVFLSIWNLSPNVQIIVERLYQIKPSTFFFHNCSSPMYSLSLLLEGLVYNYRSNQHYEIISILTLMNMWQKTIIYIVILITYTFYLISDLLSLLALSSTDDFPNP